MKVSNSRNIRFLLTAAWGDVQHGDITVIFTVDIEHVAWKELIPYYPLLDLLHSSLEEQPLDSDMETPNFPLELIDNYAKLVQVLTSTERKPHHQFMADAIIRKVEDFCAGLLSNLNRLPPEPQAICKQMFFRSLSKIQVFECLLGISMKSNSRTTTSGAAPLNTRSTSKLSPRDAPLSAELAALKQALTSKTESDLLFDALEGVRAEIAMISIASAAEQTDQKQESVDIAMENSRVSVTSAQSPLLATLSMSSMVRKTSAFPKKSPSNYSLDKVDLGVLGLTDLDIAACIQDLQSGISMHFLLPDKSFNGRLCQAVVKLPIDMNVLDVSLTIQVGRKVQTTRLLYDIQVDVDTAREGKGPTLLSYPEDVSEGRILHVLLHSRPELNLVAIDEHQRNKLMVALNRATAGTRTSAEAATRQSSASSNYLRSSMSFSSSSSAGKMASQRSGSANSLSSPSEAAPRPSASTPGSSHVAAGRPPLPSPNHSGGTRLGAIRESTSESEQVEVPEVSDFVFSIPLKIVAYCWAHTLSKTVPTDEITSDALPRIAARERMSPSFLLSEPLMLVLTSSLNEFLLFSLPAGMQRVDDPKVREMDATLRNLLNVPFPVNVLVKKKITCEIVVPTGSISFVNEKNDVIFVVADNGLLLNVYAEDDQPRANLMSSLLQSRKNVITNPQSVASGRSIVSSGSSIGDDVVVVQKGDEVVESLGSGRMQANKSGKRGEATQHPSPRGAPTQVFRSSVSTQQMSPRL